MIKSCENCDNLHFEDGCTLPCMRHRLAAMGGFVDDCWKAKVLRKCDKCLRILPLTKHYPVILLSDTTPKQLCDTCYKELLVWIKEGRK